MNTFDAISSAIGVTAGYCVMGESKLGLRRIRATGAGGSAATAARRQI
jgi:hypothetical protein